MTPIQLEKLQARYSQPIIFAPPVNWQGEVVMTKVCTFNQFEGWVDSGYGNACLWDGENWHIGRHAVFLPETIFVTEYYGYPNGAIFTKVT